MADQTINDGSRFGNGYGSPFGSGYGSGDEYGSGFENGSGNGSGFGDGFGEDSERQKIELNILSHIPDLDLPLFIGEWEFKETQVLFEKRLKG
jgi:hypothetical protein